MPHPHREGPLVIALTGERAHRLAEGLLAPRPSPAAQRLWEEIAALGGRGRRLSHDWDPAVGRLTIVAEGGPAGT
ncbi:hypothetical protein Rumeso_04825 [Rubellimicrobium mesophilum DSM 19309]|uniref:Uncharacterized protein n=1 Tax=Rubellimicrobium mesophilum DSM 19309 TaxID=442562 RepID=A0A017HGM5_9RHOB|nr:hypothetical protein [Rubellimicrobium mesophilum]EYD72949.1 hypothetical protein Rumeso_04825 [Rubellimicrobium mesophilum DSM 19309]